MDLYLTHCAMLGYLFCASVAINEISVVVWVLLISVLCTARGLEDNTQIPAPVGEG